MDALEAFTTPGRWLVVTASGAGHLIESSDPDTPVTVTRLTMTPEPREGFTHAELRRDGVPLTVTAIWHIDPVHGERDGIAVGLDMWFVLEPLGPGAHVTVRRTTPVVRIHAAPEHLDTKEAHTHG